MRRLWDVPSVFITTLWAACRPSVIHWCSSSLLLSLSLSLQIVAAILAIAGIVMMTYADGFHSHSVIGITFVVASASMSALYKVFNHIYYNYNSHKLFIWPTSHLTCVLLMVPRKCSTEFGAFLFEHVIPSILITFEYQTDTDHIYRITSSFANLLFNGDLK